MLWLHQLTIKLQWNSSNVSLTAIVFNPNIGDKSRLLMDRVNASLPQLRPQLITFHK